MKSLRLRQGKETEVAQLCPTLCDPIDCSQRAPLSMGFSRQLDCHFLLQGIFPTQGSSLGLPHCRQTLYHLSHQGGLKPTLDLQRETSLGYLRKGFELDQKADTGRVEKGAKMLKGSSPWRMKFHSVLQELSSHWMLVNLWQIALYNGTWFWSESPPLHKNDILWFILLIFHPFRFCMTEKVDSVK